jgi:hypothetical protein
LWEELENVGGAAETADAESEARLMALRLELHLLVAAYDCARWRVMLTAEQCAEVRTAARGTLLRTASSAASGGEFDRR